MRPPEDIESLLCCCEKSSPLKNSVIRDTWYSPKKFNSNNIKKKENIINKPKTEVLNLISDKKNISTETIKSNSVVPKSGCIKIKNRQSNIPINATDLRISELNILAKNKTKIILLNSDGCMNIGRPIGSKSYHLLTPNIGAVKSKPIKTEIERTNKGFIKL